MSRPDLSHRVQTSAASLPHLPVSSMQLSRSRAAQIQLAHMTGALEVWYSILVAVAWLPLATLRAHDYLQGLIFSVIFAIVTVLGQDMIGYALWHGVRPSLLPLLPFRLMPPLACLTCSGS